MTVKTLWRAALAEGFDSPRGESRPALPATDFRPASVALPGPRGRTSSAGGRQLVAAHPASPAEAARGCSPTSQFGTSTTSTTTIKEGK